MCIEGAHERDEARSDLQEFVQEGGTGDAVIRAAAIERNDDGRGVELRGNSQCGGEAVGAGSGLERELEGPGSGVENRGMEACESARDKAAQHIPRGDAADPAVWFRERGEASQSEGRQDFGRGRAVGQCSGGPGKELECVLIIKKDFVVFGGGARQACGRATFAGAKGVSEVMRREREWNLWLVVKDGLGNGRARGWRTALRVGQRS